MIDPKRSLKVLILMSILLLVSALLVAIKSQPLTTLNAANNAFYQLEQQNNDLELALLHIRNGMVLHYDNLRYLNQNINSNFATIQLLLADEGPEMMMNLTNLQHHIQNKENLTEQFKADYSILKNAIAFLPQQLEQLLSEENAHNKQQLLTLQRLFFHQFMSTETDNTLLRYLQPLKTEHAGNEKWQNILIHIEHAINKQRNVNDHLGLIKQHPVIAHIAQLHKVLAKQLEAQLKQQQQAIYATYLLVTLLLLFSFWALFRYHGVNQQIGNLNQHLGDRIADATKNIREEKQKVEEASQAKSQFLTRMSHELRTPLNAIIGFSQLQQLLADEDTTEQQKENTEQILDAGRHLLGLINDMLDISHLEQDKIDIDVEDCELSRVISQSVALVGKQAQQSNITIHVNQTNERVSADNLRLKQVLINLLTNAIKYNKVDGTITITVKAVDDDQVQISVEDSGWGIDTADQEKIFEPFTRLTYAEQSEIQGTGIGLALTKFLVMHMNGTIGLRSQKNKGTTFWVTLPKAKKALPYPDTSTVIEANEVIKHQFCMLYIEDNPASVKLLQQLFNHKYPTITLLTADTAEKGIVIAKSKCPDMIFIDINLPQMSGNEAVAVLKAVPYLKQVQMIALSADAHAKQIKKALGAGFDDYLTKPVDLAKISQLLSTFDSGNKVS
ncbi:MAG: signal transduction histidine kinase/ActR/RegA family two-component response regulator [Phenylobacterium sp.]|jgi:signal transduction histidine kinase/ActR/RegA family two-component response regulator